MILDLPIDRLHDVLGRLSILGCATDSKDVVRWNIATESGDVAE